MLLSVSVFFFLIVFLFVCLSSACFYGKRVEPEFAIHDVNAAAGGARASHC